MLLGNQLSDSHRGIELRHDTDETGNEQNLNINDMNEDIDQHQTRSNQGSNDIHDKSVGREVSEQGTSEEDFSYGGERNVPRDSDNENNDEQQQTISNQVSSDHQHETNQSAGSNDETSDDDSYVGIVMNPCGELLTVLTDDQEALDREIPLDDTSPITFGALLSDYAKELPDVYFCALLFPFFSIPKSCSDHISKNGIISRVLPNI